MAKKEKPVELFENCLSKIMVDKLRRVDNSVKKINDSMSDDDVANILEEGNSLLSFACGRDDALYEEWRYRFIVDDQGKRWIIQGREIGVDPRDWSGKEDPED